MTYYYGMCADRGQHGRTVDTSLAAYTVMQVLSNMQTTELPKPISIGYIS